MLRAVSPEAWVQSVLSNFDSFLVDHANNERKASANALSLVVHCPDKLELVDIMIDVAREELEHFEQVYKIMRERGVQLGKDSKDPYVNKLLKQARNDREGRLLDRLILGCIIEARGCERFGLVARHHPDKEMSDFYRELARSEARHREDFLKLAKLYFPESEVDEWLNIWLDREAKILNELEIRPMLH